MFVHKPGDILIIAALRRLVEFDTNKKDSRHPPREVLDFFPTRAWKVSLMPAGNREFDYDKETMRAHCNAKYPKYYKMALYIREKHGGKAVSIYDLVDFWDLENAERIKAPRVPQANHSEQDNSAVQLLPDSSKCREDKVLNTSMTEVPSRHEKDEVSTAQGFQDLFLAVSLLHALGYIDNW